MGHCTNRGARGLTRWVRCPNIPNWIFLNCYFNHILYIRLPPAPLNQLQYTQQQLQMKQFFFWENLYHYTVSIAFSSFIISISDHWITLTVNLKAVSSFSILYTALNLWLYLLLPAKKSKKLCLSQIKNVLAHCNY